MRCQTSRSAGVFCRAKLSFNRDLRLNSRSKIFPSSQKANSGMARLFEFGRFRRELQACDRENVAILESRVCF
jgi:hypothetical protein